MSNWRGRGACPCMGSFRPRFEVKYSENKIMKKIPVFIFLLFAINAYSQVQFSIKGHRGARGWLPENTIPSF